MFKRFTDETKAVLERAFRIAAEEGAAELEPRHLSAALEELKNREGGA